MSNMSGKATLQMVAELGIALFDDGDIVVPSKLKTRRDLQPALSPGGADVIWFGIELRCSEVPMSVCLFPQLQAHLYNFFREQCSSKPSLWAAGIAVALRYSNAIGIVESRWGQIGIDLIVRGTEETGRDCYALLHTLKEETLLNVEKFSPGSDISERILSSRELSSLNWSKSSSLPEVTYSKEDVEKAMECGGEIRPENSLQDPEDAYALMAVPDTHIQLMSTDGYSCFCHAMNRLPKSGQKQASWRELARRLGMRPHQTPPEDSVRANSTHNILQWWARRSSQHTVERLLAEVNALNHVKAAAILEEELVRRPNIVPTPVTENLELEDSDSEDSNASEDEGAGCACSGEALPQPITKSTMLKLAEDGTCSAEAQPIEESTLREIFRCFNSEEQCVDLAMYLHVSQGSDIIDFLRSSNPHINAHIMAFKIMKTWMGENSDKAFGEVLHRVLRDKLNMRDAALQFEAELLAVVAHL